MSVLESLRDEFPGFYSAVPRHIFDKTELDYLRPPLGDDEIEEMEGKLQASLPSSYKRFMRLCGGFSGPIGEISLCLESWPFFHEFQPLEEMIPADRKQIRRRGLPWPPESNGMLCFADYWLEMDGDQVLFDVANGLVEEEYPIFYYAHEEGTVRKLETSFENWINKALDGQDHY